eukprot:9298175-Heterocapsa_arctica.AAC.1
MARTTRRRFPRRRAQPITRLAPPKELRKLTRITKEARLEVTWDGKCPMGAKRLAVGGGLPVAGGLRGS